MVTYAIGDHVMRNTATVLVNQIAQWNRQYPGGRRGIVIGIDEQFTLQPYLVRWEDDDKPAYYAGRDLLPATVPAAQASLFEVA